MAYRIRVTIKPPMTLYTDMCRVVWTLDSVWGYIYWYDIVIYYWSYTLYQPYMMEDIVYWMIHKLSL